MGEEKELRTIVYLNILERTKQKKISEVFAGQEDLMQRFIAGYAFELKTGEIGVCLICSWVA